MARGFLKTVGAAKRMRFVSPGYDANDMSVPSNEVVFDSEAVGNLSLHAQGTYDSGVQSGTGIIFNDVPIISWPNLPYVPLFTAQYAVITSPAGTHSGYWQHSIDYLPLNFRLWARTDGVSMFWRRNGTSTPGRVLFRWQAYRYPT